MQDRNDPGKTVMFNRGFETIEALSSFCANVSDKGMTAFYALGTFVGNREETPEGRIRWRRKAAMAQSFKTFALDIDCGEGKPYPTQREGIAALGAFLKAGKLPKPLIVSSGYGLHCYWPLATEIDSLTWRLTSEALKSLAAKHNLAIDESKVCDPAMVLRPIETNNYKRGTTIGVKLICDVAAFDNNTLLPLLTQASGAPKVVKQTEKSVLIEAVEAGVEYPPAEAGKIVQRCAQVRRITFHRGANAAEPEWYAALGVAAFCENPEQVAIEWSAGHAEYDEDSTLTKLHQWKKSAGPTRCSQFDKLHPGLCSQCSYQGKVGSPIRLGAPDPKPIAYDASPTVPHPFDEPPSPFKRTQHGITVDIDGVPLVICNYDIFPSHIVNDPTNGYDEVVWYWNKPFKGYTKATVRMSHVFNDNITELNSTLADNGVLIETRQKQIYMGAYMRAYIQKLQKAQAATELYTSFGWKQNNTVFVIGSTEFRRAPDGTVTSHEVGVSRSIIDKRLDQHFEPKGNPELWTMWTKLLNAPGLEGHQFALGVGFAAPLVALTALNGFCVSLLGESGTGKSSMQSWVDSIYGNPYALGMKKEDTKLAIVQRMGMVANLPVTIDECTFIEEDKLADLTYWSTQGQDKNRANEVVASNWALPVLISSNKSLRDKLMAFTADSDAMSMRLLEFNMRENKVFGETQDYGRRVAEMLRANYGHVGRQYIAYIMSLGADVLRERIQETVKHIEARYNIQFVGKERFWVLALSLTSLGNQLAHEAGLIRYQHEAGTAWAIGQIQGQRDYVESAHTTPYDMLASYINHNVGTALTVVYRPNGATMAAEPIPRTEVFIRKEIYTDHQGKADRGVIYLDRRHFQKWLVSHGFDFKAAVDAFEADAIEVKPNASGKVTMGKNTPLRLGQVPVIGLNLNHAKLAYMLDMPEIVEDTKVVQLRR